MSICDTIDCTQGLPNAVIPNCPTNFGTKIVAWILGDINADAFASESAMEVEANWTTRFNEPQSGDPAVRLVILNPLHIGLKEAGDQETQEAPYGGMELVGTTQRFTAAIRYHNNDLIDAVNELRCRKSFTMWALTDMGYVLGGVTGYKRTSIQWGNMQIVGIGNGTNRNDLVAETRQVDDSTFAYTPFLANYPQ